MHRGLVALSASAIAAVYLAGYTRTQSADASIDAAAAPLVATPIADAPTVAPSATATAVSPPLTRRAPRSAVPPTPATAPRPTVPPPPAASAPASASGSPGAVASPGYKDGTYDGQGTSRRGDVWVSVTVQEGQISNVSITRSTLQYPVRDIAGLPGQVVQRQSAQVDIVSRATYSSQAFRGAVSQALAKAV